MINYYSLFINMNYKKYSNYKNFNNINYYKKINNSLICYNKMNIIYYN